MEGRKCELVGTVTTIRPTSGVVNYCIKRCCILCAKFVNRGNSIVRVESSVLGYRIRHPSSFETVLETWGIIMLVLWKLEAVPLVARCAGEDTLHEQLPLVHDPCIGPCSSEPS